MMFLWNMGALTWRTWWTWNHQPGTVMLGWWVLGAAVVWAALATVRDVLALRGMSVELRRMRRCVGAERRCVGRPVWCLVFVEQRSGHVAAALRIQKP